MNGLHYIYALRYATRWRTRSKTFSDTSHIVVLIAVLDTIAGLGETETKTQKLSGGSVLRDGLPVTCSRARKSAKAARRNARVESLPQFGPDDHGPSATPTRVRRVFVPHLRVILRPVVVAAVVYPEVGGGHPGATEQRERVGPIEKAGFVFFEKCSIFPRRRFICFGRLPNAVAVAVTHTRVDRTTLFFRRALHDGRRHETRDLVRWPNGRYIFKRTNPRRRATRHTGTTSSLLNINIFIICERVCERYKFICIILFAFGTTADCRREGGRGDREIKPAYN